MERLMVGIDGVSSGDGYGQFLAHEGIAQHIHNIIVPTALASLPFVQTCFLCLQEAAKTHPRNAEERLKELETFSANVSDRAKAGGEVTEETRWKPAALLQKEIEED